MSPYPLPSYSGVTAGGSNPSTSFAVRLMGVPVALLLLAQFVALLDLY